MKSNVKLNFVYSLCYNLINVIAPFIIIPYVSRVLGADNLGLYSYSNSVAYYFVIFAMLGVSNYGNRTIAASRNDKTTMSKLFCEIYFLQLFLSIITTILYLTYCLTICKNFIIGFSLIFYVLSAGLDITWLYYGIENFKFITLRNFLIKVLNILLVFIFVKESKDTVVYTLIMSTGFLLANLFMWFNIKKHIIFVKPNFNDILKHLKPNLILFIPVIAISFYNFMDKIMLGNFSNMSEVGYYDNAEKIMTIPQTIVTSLGTVMLPRISNLVSSGDNSEIKEYLKKSLLFVSFISSACTFGIITVANEFIMLYLGSGFVKCSLLLYFLMPCLIFKAFANVFRSQYIIPKKKDNVYVISVIAGAIINFIFNLLFIHRFQAIGACIGTILAEVSVCIYQMHFVLKEQKVGKSIFQGFGFQLCGLLMFIIVRAIPVSGSLIFILISKIVLGGILYSIIACIYYMLIIKSCWRRK